MDWRIILSLGTYLALSTLLRTEDWRKKGKPTLSAITSYLDIHDRFDLYLKINVSCLDNARSNEFE